MVADFTLLADINPGVGSSAPYGIVAVGSTAYFVAPKPGSTTELELWKSDGTTAGTSLVIDLLSDGFGSSPEDLTDVNGMLYFSALSSTPGNNRDLWKSNGTAAGTTLVSANIVSGSLLESEQPLIAFIGDNLFFQGVDAFGDVELWRTIISTNMSSRVMDINTSGSSEPGSLTVFNNELYFAATDSATGRELWKTNPTTLLTTRVSDFDGAASFNPSSFEVFGNNLYFAGTTIADGIELYRISNTVNATPTLVMNITPNETIPTAAVGSSNPTNLTAVNGTLLFTIFPTVDNSVALVAPEIWKTDGTSTVRVFNGFSTSQFVYDLSRLTVIGNSAFFSVIDDTTLSFQAWKSDGTTAGTVRATELTAGTTITDPQEIARVGTLTYFVGSSPSAGVEIFVTNQAPTNIALSASSVFENSPINTVVGTLSTTDPNGFDSFTYSLVTGTGSTNNASFNISGNQLRVNGAIDFEATPTLSIRVRSTDSLNPALFTERPFTITVTDLAEVLSTVVAGSNANGSQRSTVRSIAVNFDGPVVLTNNPFEIRQRGGANPVVSNSFTPILNGSGQTIGATVTFSGSLTRVAGALLDGNYELIIDAANVKRSNVDLDGDRNGVAGGVYRFGTLSTDRFFAFFGDSDGNRNVRGSDVNDFSRSVGKRSTDVGYRAEFDFDNNGIIRGIDVNEFSKASRLSRLTFV